LQVTATTSDQSQAKDKLTQPERDRRLKLKSRSLKVEAQNGLIEAQRSKPEVLPDWRGLTSSELIPHYGQQPTKEEGKGKK